MQRPEQFICISYSTIDFLIPNNDIASAVGLSDFSTDMIDVNSGTYDFDELAADFKQEKRDTTSYTMVILKTDGLNHLSFVTSRECKVCEIPLSNFSLFSPDYSESLKAHGILACICKEDRLQYLLDIKKALEYKYNMGEMLEEI